MTPSFHPTPTTWITPEMEEKFNQALAEFVRKRQLACSELTQQQMAKVIRQALACGDIQKLVRATDNAQQVIYIPFAETERLTGRIQHLEALLKQHGIEEEI